MKAACGQLSQEQSDLVELAWRRINATQAPTVRYADTTKHFNASRHPSVKSGERTQDNVTQEFLQTFGTHNKIWNEMQEGPVSKAEFFNYYTIVAAAGQLDKHAIQVWNVDVREMNTNTTAGKGPLPCGIVM